MHVVYYWYKGILQMISFLRAEILYNSVCHNVILVAVCQYLPEECNICNNAEQINSYSYVIALKDLNEMCNFLQK